MAKILQESDLINYNEIAKFFFGEEFRSLSGVENEDKRAIQEKIEKLYKNEGITNDELNFIEDNEKRDFFINFIEKLRNFGIKYNEITGENIGLNLRYYQILSLFYSYVYMNKYYEKDDNILSILELNIIRNDVNIISNMLSYWMATGSGKTIVMMFNIIIFINFIKEFNSEAKFEIFLTNPLKTLVEQHTKEFKSLINGLKDSYDINSNIITLPSLLNVGGRTDIEQQTYWNIEDKNLYRLILVDEGHNGTGSEEGKWKGLIKKMANNNQNSFIFEYSATYSNVSNIELYKNQTIYYYNLGSFNIEDRYGKLVSSENIDSNLAKEISSFQDKNYKDRQLKAFFDNVLKKYNSKNDYFELYKKKRSYTLKSKPLIVLLGGRNIISDINSKDEKITINTIQEIIEYFAKKEGREFLQKLIGTEKIKNFSLSKKSENEILLKYGNKYFGIINIGDVSKFLSVIDSKLIDVESYFNDDWDFGNIDNNEDCLIVIGNKKFSEGWNCFRVSIIGLIGKGLSKGTEIIQVLGRGLRLEYGQRKQIDKERNNLLENLDIFALSKTYLDEFVKGLEGNITYPMTFFLEVSDKDSDLEKHKLPIFTHNSKTNLDFINLYFREEKGKLKIEYIDEIDCKDEENKKCRKEIKLETITIKYSDNSKKSIKKDELSKIYEDENNYFIYGKEQGYTQNLINKNINLFLENIDNKKLLNLIISEYNDINIGEDILIEENYTKIAIELFNNFIIKIYNRINHIKQTSNIQNRFLSKGKNDYLSMYKIKLDTSDLDIKYWYDSLKGKNNNGITFSKKDLVKVLEKKNNKNIIVNNFNKNLNVIYTPLLDKEQPIEIKIGDLIEQKGILSLDNLEDEKRNKLKKFYKEKFEFSPKGLNPGEVKFLKKLNDYIGKEFEVDLSEGLRKSDFEIFLLRNEESLKSIGFFLENQESFFPDFILWVKYKEKCFVAFIDPKGEADIFTGTKLKDKVIESIEESKNKTSEKVIYSSFFINTTKINKYKLDSKIENYSKEKCEYIFYPNDEDNYISRLFKDFIIKDLVNGSKKNLSLS